MEIVILGIVVVVGIALILIYNQLVHAKVKVEEALSGIDVALSKRYNILSNLQSTVKGAAAHEKEVLMNISEFRSNALLNEKEKLNQEYDGVQQRLLAIAEAYPDLKVNANFLDLQRAIVDCEEHLQAARRFYNSNTAYYNEKRLSFPTNLLASLFNYQKKDYFMAQMLEKENVEINL